MIQRRKVIATSAAFGGIPTIIETTEKDGEYVTYTDHIAEEAELMRLLKEYRTDDKCHDFCRGEDRCSLCIAVDALEGK
jgi:hypothetical protein